MDSRQHSIQLGARPGPDAGNKRPIDDDGRMSSELYRAVCDGNKEEAMALLLGGAATGQVDGIDHVVSTERNTVLHLAAKLGHDELIQELCASSGGNILLSSQNSVLDTPLHCAARAGHDRSVSLLIQLAWDCEDQRIQNILGCKNEAGDTALHLAARFGHHDVVKVIVSKAPGLASEVNNAGVSPLYLAVMSGSVPAVRAITTACSDASAAGPSSQNALHAAVFQGSEMVSAILHWMPGPSLASEADENGSNPLHFASSDGDLCIVRAILSVTPPCMVRIQDSEGLSALHVAADMGHVNVAHTLLFVCPDAADLRDDRGRTFVHTAASRRHSNVVSLAIGKMLHGLLNAQDGEGNTPLHLAVAACAPNVVETLMWRGQVRADVMNNDGHMPFDIVARSSSFFSMLGMVVTLAAFGAQSRPQRQDRVEKWRGHDITKRVEKTMDSLAVVAVLIATVAFTAANSVPGSYEQSDGTAPDRYGKIVAKGMVVLQGKNIFKCFLVLDSLALVTSVVAVVLLVYGKASRFAGSWKSFVAALHCIWASLLSMILAFYAALSAVTSTRAVYGIVLNILYFGFYILCIVVTYYIAPPVSKRTIWKVLWRTGLRRDSVLTRHIKRQYPVANFYVPNLLLFVATNLLGLVGYFVVAFFTQQALREATPHRGLAPEPSSVLS